MPYVNETTQYDKRYLNLRQWRQKNPGYQDGLKNPSWKGGLSKSHICRLAYRVLTKYQIDQHTCQTCGLVSRKDRWNIHHKNGNRADNRLDNLQVLCPRCHNIAHGRHEYRRDPRTGRYMSVGS